jgi:hypothetical protein
MKYRFLIISLFLSVSMQADLAFSQKKGENSVNSWPGNAIKVDGKINDWNDSLASYNADTKFYYAISNNDENIYLAIKSINSADISRIFAGGISFLINTEGKKKPGYTITFPVIERKNVRNPKSKNSRSSTDSPDIKEIRKQMLAQIKEIKVEGFKTIIDGGISLYNNYGIQAAVAFDDNDHLVYEVAVPLSLLDLSAESPVLLAYNIKINGLVRPQMPGGVRPDGRSSMQTRSGNNAFGSSSGRPDGIETSKLFSSTDFWIRSQLAKKQ